MRKLLTTTRRWIGYLLLAVLLMIVIGLFLTWAANTLALFGVIAFIAFPLLEWTNRQ